MLKRPAHRTYIGCRLHIQKYMQKHLSRWCDFANETLGIGLQEKDIVFVSGFTKTTVWAEAAFSNSSADGELVISGGCFVPSASGEFRVSLSHSTAPTVFAREGPLDRLLDSKEDSEALEMYDQCIFLNYYKMKSRRPWRRGGVMRAAAGPHSLSSDSGDDDDVAGATMPSSDEDSIIFDDVRIDSTLFLRSVLIKYM